MNATEEREYTTVDKSAWPDGPWKTEPDKIQFVDGETGYPCLIVRSPLGALCGYVGISPDHPLYGKSYSGFIPEWCTCDGQHVPYSMGCEATPEERLDVHGGITYSAFCQDGPEEQTICHIPAPGEPDHLFWFGFDMGHHLDLMPTLAMDRGRPMVGEVYRDVAYVRAECARLAAQLKQYEHSLTP